MILGLGIDIIKNDRIIKSNSEDFRKQILCNEELEMYGKKKSHNASFLCGRFAAKEAIIKALSGFENPHMKEIKIFNDDLGKPYVVYKNYNILISISHEKNYTVAEAILIQN